MSNPKRKIAAKKPEALFGRVVSILEQARGTVVRAVNTNMVLAYWLIGREIVQELQGGDKRAAYGKQLLLDLSTLLVQRYGNGFSVPNLQNFRKFYLAYQTRIVSAPPIQYPLGRKLIPSPKSHPAGDELPQGFSPQLSWSHYRVLMRVDNIEARDFYEREAVAGAWDKRTLERQVHSIYYERFLRLEPMRKPVIKQILTPKPQTRSLPHA